MHYANSSNTFAGITNESRIRKPPGGDTHDIFDLESRQKSQAEHIFADKHNLENMMKDMVFTQSAESIPAKFAGLTDETRIRKPPGGDTNDIFNMESRQKLQYNQQYGTKIQLDPKFQETTRIASVDFAGITNETRVRKPPGGDTHDIFDMEDRQRLQSAQYGNSRKQKSLGFLIPHNGEGIESPHRSLRLQRDLLSVMSGSSAYQQNKENLHLVSGATSHAKGDEDDLVLKHDLDSNVASPEWTTKKYSRHNPITGEMSEMEVSRRAKLSDCSNLKSTQDRPLVMKEFETPRPSVRVHQPPGGASSIIF